LAVWNIKATLAGAGVNSWVGGGAKGISSSKTARCSATDATIT